MENPEVLVIGGNIAQSWDLFMNDVTGQLQSSVSKMPQIVKAALAEDAALMSGACGFQMPSIAAEK